MGDNMSTHICGWALFCDDCNRSIERDESLVQSDGSSIRSDWATTEEYWATAPDRVLKSNPVRASYKKVRKDVLSREIALERGFNKKVRIDISSREITSERGVRGPVTVFVDDKGLVPRTNEHIMVMEEILPPILRKHGAFGAKDGDSIDILDGVHFMGLAEDAQKNVHRDYVHQLKDRNIVFPISYASRGSIMPLQFLLVTVQNNLSQWEVVKLFLSKFPPHMAKQALLWKKNCYESRPLHDAARDAPLCAFVKMLELAPEAASIRNKQGSLPLHIAAYHRQVVQVELLAKIYPRGILLKDNLGHTPIDEAFQKSFELDDKSCERVDYVDEAEIMNAMIKGLMAGLSNDDSCTQAIAMNTKLSEMSNGKGSDKALSFLHIAKFFIETYKRSEECDASEMLVKVYRMMAERKIVMIVDRSLEVVFGKHLGENLVLMDVEYKLLSTP